MIHDSRFIIYSEVLQCLKRVTNTVNSGTNGTILYVHYHAATVIAATLEVRMRARVHYEYAYGSSFIIVQGNLSYTSVRTLRSVSAQCINNQHTCLAIPNTL